MNYFLILGIIVLIVLLLGVLLNSISRFAQQSDKNDVIFTILGFLLALSIMVSFIITVNILQRNYDNKIVEIIEPAVVETAILAKTNNYIYVAQDGKILPIRITVNTKFIDKDDLNTEKIVFTTKKFEAPKAWYMFDWKVDALNNTVVYFADALYY